MAARHFDFISCKRGEKIGGNKNSYYITCKDYDISPQGYRLQKLYPIVFGVILNNEKRISFEITVDCLNLSKEEGIKIINSIVFL